MMDGNAFAFAGYVLCFAGSVCMAYSAMRKRAWGTFIVSASCASLAGLMLWQVLPR
jgi:hypothetical protein